MSDSLPENSFSGALRVVKLTSGEEIIGLVSEPSPDKLNIKLPAKLENYYTKDETGEMVEYVKLTNYLMNIKSFEVFIPTTVVVYTGHPTIELEKMYEVFFMTMQTDPKLIVRNMPENLNGTENGLQLLNELFNNEDFVNFVNDLIENFEGVEILLDDLDDDDSIEENDITEDFSAAEAPKPRKKKKRNTMKPEKKSLPYNPDKDPKDPESWSDNPGDYLN
jgi:hypothetical protein